MKELFLRKWMTVVICCCFLYGFSQKKTPLIYPEHIDGFSIEQQAGYMVLRVAKDMSETQQHNKDNFIEYILVHQDSLQLKRTLATTYKNVVEIPVKRMVVSSTTHLSAIELLKSASHVVGFPGTDYISSALFRDLVHDGKIVDLGPDQSMNIERLLQLEADVFIGYTVGAENRSYQTIRNAGITLIQNHDWLSSHPLSRAAWIYFFGALFNKIPEADRIFTEIKKEYEQTAALAQTSQHKPTVMSGAMYENVWYAAGGKSWGAQFIADANATYSLPSPKKSSEAYSLEYVLKKAADATFWLGPGQFISYEEMLGSQMHYQEFKAFKQKSIFTYAAKKGPSGGVLYYELAPQRPDIVLKDIVSILHPELLPNHKRVFFSPLND